MPRPIVRPGPDAIAARHAAVLGGPPRVGPLETRSFSPELRALVMRMVRLSEIIQSRDSITHLLDPDMPDAALAEALATLPEITRTMLRHPSLFGLHTDVGVELIANGTLTPRDRELVVLRTAWLCQAPYEWGEHVLVAKVVGLTGEEIERVTFGSEAEGWSDADRTILRAVEELYADAMISDATWEALAARFDDRQLIELPILVGQYQAVAYYQNALRLRLHRGNAGLEAR